MFIKGPDGQIKYDMLNEQQFTDIAVSKLKKYGTDGLKTTGWKIGDYTFQVKTESAQACGLDAVSEKKDVKRGGSYYEHSPTPAPSPKKENEVAVHHLTPTATPILTVTHTVTPIVTPIPSSTPSPAVSATPAALIPGSEFLFAIICIIIVVCLFRYRK